MDDRLLELRGWIVKRRRSSSGERALLAAVVYQALVDASAGDRQARSGWDGGSGVVRA